MIMLFMYTVVTLNDTSQVWCFMFAQLPQFFRYLIQTYRSHDKTPCMTTWFANRHTMQCNTFNYVNYSHVIENASNRMCIVLILFVCIHHKYAINIYSSFFYVFLQRSTFVGTAWSFGFFFPATTANDLRLRRIFDPRFYRLHLFSYLNS